VITTPVDSVPKRPDLASIMSIHAGADADAEREPPLTRITHATLYDKVYEELRNALMNGRFVPGEVLTIRGVAQALGTSVMPVREALRRLAAERAIQFHADRSIRVPLLDEHAFDELLQMRLLLEGRAAAAAALAMTAAELNDVRDINDAYANPPAGSTPMARLLANRHFHFAVYRAAHAPLLLSLIEMMWLQSGPYLMIPIRRRTADEVSSYLAAGAVHHRDLLEALARREPAAAETAVQADIGDAARAYRDALAAHADEESVGEDSAKESGRRGRK
jgi:DNA-binding GntR family transcriptional regulator